MAGFKIRSIVDKVKGKRRSTGSIDVLPTEISAASSDGYPNSIFNSDTHTLPEEDELRDTPSELNFSTTGTLLSSQGSSRGGSYTIASSSLASPSTYAPSLAPSTAPSTATGTSSFTYTTSIAVPRRPAPTPPRLGYAPALQQQQQQQQQPEPRRLVKDSPGSAGAQSPLFQRGEAQPVSVEVTGDDVRQAIRMLRQLFQLELDVYGLRFASVASARVRRDACRRQADALRGEIERAVRIWRATSAGRWTEEESELVAYCADIVHLLGRFAAQEQARRVVSEGSPYAPY